jgi:hypothetical protein
MQRLNDYRTRLMLVGIVAAIVFGGGRVKADFVFGESTNLGPTVNTPYIEFPSCISADDLELYFSSNRPGSIGGRDLWVMKRTTREDDWEAPINLGPAINSSAIEDCSCMSADGLELYFDAWQRPGGRGAWDIWVSRRQTRNDPWSTAVNLGPPINSSSWDQSPSISADGLEFYFCSNRSGGQGTDDLWVAKRATINDPWEEPVNLGATVNSSAHESGAKISSDSLVLFFSGDTISPYRPGGVGLSDIWMTRRVMRDNVWREPVNLGPLVNSSSQEYGPVISQDGSTLFFMSNRFGGLGGDDIYQAPIIPIVDLNSDGIVDSADMCIMVDHWGTENQLCDIGPMPWGDGVVDTQDLIVLSEYLFEDINDPTLLAHWAFDETEGMVVADSAGDNNGYALGDPVWQPDGGLMNGTLQLDGIDDYVVTGTPPNPADGPLSVLVWVKGGGPGQVIISQQGAANWLAIDAEGNLMTELKDPGRSAVSLQSQTIITDAYWHRICFVWDGANRILYVDGVAVAQDPQDRLGSSESGLYIGCGKVMEAGTYWSGLIDDVRIYNRAVHP